MRAVELRKLETLFGNLTRLQRFMTDAAAVRADGASCGCALDEAGRWGLAGQCKPVPPDHCRSVVHVAARTVLHQMRIPVEQLTDPQLDEAIAGLAALVDRAPGLSEVDFVTGMQSLLHATPSAETETSEETPAP